MGLFGKLFDFDHDGETSMSEEVFGLGVAAAIIGAAAEEEEQAAQEEALEEIEGFDIGDDFDADDMDSMDPDELEDKLDELRNLMFDLEAKEPDDLLSDAYDVWEEKHQALEEKIERLESILGF